jgi:hypothetical protein
MRRLQVPCCVSCPSKSELSSNFYCFWFAALNRFLRPSNGESGRESTKFCVVGGGNLATFAGNARNPRRNPKMPTKFHRRSIKVSSFVFASTANRPQSKLNRSLAPISHPNPQTSHEISIFSPSQLCSRLQPVVNRRCPQQLSPTFMANRCGNVETCRRKRTNRRNSAVCGLIAAMLALFTMFCFSVGKPTNFF